jgi:hypothetical protein
MLMSEGSPQVWRCSHGHGLGIIQKNGQKVSQLLLYRHAIDLSVDDPESVDVMAIVESAIDIRCDLCGDCRTWAPNQAAFERLMERHKKDLSLSREERKERI